MFFNNYFFNRKSGEIKSTLKISISRIQIAPSALNQWSLGMTDIKVPKARPIIAGHAMPGKG